MWATVGSPSSRTGSTRTVSLAVVATSACPTTSSTTMAEGTIVAPTVPARSRSKCSSKPWPTSSSRTRQTPTQPCPCAPWSTMRHTVRLARTSTAETCRQVQSTHGRIIEIKGRDTSTKAYRQIMMQHVLCTPYRTMHPQCQLTKCRTCQGVRTGPDFQRIMGDSSNRHNMRGRINESK